MKKSNIPQTRAIEMPNPNPLCSAASGIKCMNASPINAPAEKLIKNRIIFLNFSIFMDNVKSPTKEIKLTIKTLNNE